MFSSLHGWFFHEIREQWTALSFSGISWYQSKLRTHFSQIIKDKTSIISYFCIISGAQVRNRGGSCFLCSIEILWVLSPLSILKLSKIMHWMDARALRRKDAFKGERPWGERASVIHGSPIGKPYPSSVASLRSLDFSNLANWNISVAKGRKINRDPVSSGERERNKGFNPQAVSFNVDWMMEKPASSKLRQSCLTTPYGVVQSQQPLWGASVGNTALTGWGAQFTCFIKGWKIWPKKVIALFIRSHGSILPSKTRRVRMMIAFTRERGTTL